MNQLAFEEFGDLQEQMQDFSSRVEQYLSQKRGSLIEHKQNHYIKLNELRSQEQKLQAEINENKTKEENLKLTIKQSLESLQLQQIKVDELKHKQSELLDHKNHLDKDIEQLRKEMLEIESDLAKSEDNLARQLKRDYPELVKFEVYLGLRIEVIDIDIIKFVFTNIDSNDFERQFWFELHIKEDTFQIKNPNPSLQPETVSSLESEFKKHKEFVKFLKSVRNKFKDLI
ncbi:uncharacterized protein PRCAT00006231001 [Priceomyces carsonii]|uniref:uncharacterized protein n=1 Tax=Priceomyces carsonii TaxID=28549 RepID=UPI002ED9D012|nr:unnamed protein product [Priceomyces carsonii]